MLFVLALVVGTAAVATGAARTRQRAVARRRPPRRHDHVHPARHDLSTGLLQRNSFEHRIRAADGFITVAVVGPDSRRDIHRLDPSARADQLMRLLPEGSALGDLGDDRVAIAFPPLTNVIDAISVLRRAAGPRLAIGLAVGGPLPVPADGEGDFDVESVLRGAVAMCRQAEAIAAPTPRTDQDRAFELRKAIANGEIEVRFQPEVDLVGGAVRSMEALARWTHPVRGPISPEFFIPLAERSGTILALTEFVLERAVGACAGWHAAGSPVRVAVNVSSRCLASERLPGIVAGALARSGIEASWLTLEITEGEAVRHEPVCVGVLASLVSLGVRISIDDFGTGYSSFTQLLRLAVDEVKIDRSFVSRCLEGVTEAAVVRSVVELGQRLGIEVVAEGVETDAVREHLAGLGCGAMQGYLCSEAMPAETAARWLEARRRELVPSR